MNNSIVCYIALTTVLVVISLPVFGQDSYDTSSRLTNSSVYLSENAAQANELRLIPDSKSYQTIKSEIRSIRQKYKEQVNKDLPLDSIQRSFTEHLVNSIIPFWYGTLWSFEGHTAVPNTGEIACGYFVSTTLRDMGLQLNRYKLAQKSPIEEARVLACGLPVMEIKQTDTSLAIEEIHGCTKNGIYFIGFDQIHVGYLLKRKNKMFLIHSNYVAPNSVCIEEIENSVVFRSYQIFYVVPISENQKLIDHWLAQTKVL